MQLARASFYHKPTREEKTQQADMELRQLIEEIHLEWNEPHMSAKKAGGFVHSIT
jgi:hypothetical protein